MIDEIETKRLRFISALDAMPERTRPSYEEEATKTELRAKIRLCDDLLAMPKPSVGLAVKQTYRVELVDYIDAESEHQAIDIFTQAMADVDLADDNFDVYEVDPKTKKAVKE